MPQISTSRQLKGTLRLLQVQLARAGETFDREKGLAACLESGKITEEDASFIRQTLALQDDAQALDQLDGDAAAAIIKKVHKLTSCNLNMGDSA